jgi:protein-tyrosine-phosphatase
LPWIASFRRVFLGQERFEVERLQDPMPGIRQFDRDLKMPIAELGLRFSRTYRQSIRGRFDRHSMTVTSSLLIVCKGNINRSLVAEQLLKIRGFTRVRSAGLLNMSGRRPSRFAETFLGKTVGVDASGCKSQSIERAMKESERIDFVFCFERTQILEISRRFPQLRGKVFLFSSIGPGPLRSQEIADPHGRTPEAYLACFQTIENIVNQLPHADPVQQSTHSNIEVGLSERESY